MLLSAHHLASFLVLANLAVGATAQDGAQISPKSSCRSFTQGFYSWYVPLTQKRMPRPAFEIAVERKADLFAPALLRALQADSKAQQRAKGEIVGIDFDPFVSSQDPADHYDLRNIKADREKCSVEVWRNSPTETSQKSATPDAIAELSQQAGRWRFENFRYPDLNTDLMSVLASLRKERGEQQ